MNITKEYYYNIHTVIDIPFAFLTFIFLTGLCAANAKKRLKNQSTQTNYIELNKKSHL